MEIETFNNIIDFIKSTEKLKTTLRHSYTNDPSRVESVAEHTWSSMLLLLVLKDHIQTEFDICKTLKMLVIHDLAESITGDVPSFDTEGRKGKLERETKAINQLKDKLPDSKFKNELLDLFEEMEEYKTNESKVAHAMDKADVVIQHNISDIKTWDQNDFNKHPYYKNEKFEFDQFLKEFKKHLDNWSMQKIESTDNLDRISDEHRKKYTSKQR